MSRSQTRQSTEAWTSPTSNGDLGASVKYGLTSTIAAEATIEGDMNVLGILGADPDVRNGFNAIRVNYEIDADASPEDVEALVAQSQKRSAVFDVITNPTNVTVTVS